MLDAAMQRFIEGKSAPDMDSQNSLLPIAENLHRSQTTKPLDSQQEANLSVLFSCSNMQDG